MAATLDIPIATYRQQAEGAIRRAFRTRDFWLRDLDAMCDDLRERGVRPALQRAALVGNEYTSRFAYHWAEFHALRPPRGAEGYHNLWIAWLRKLEEANGLLANAASQRNMWTLERAAHTLGEARPLLAALTGDRDALDRLLSGDDTAGALPA